MPDDGTDLLAFVSSFSHFAGPNNPVLDLGNYLFSSMGVRFAVVTTRNPVDPDFARQVRFPVHRELSGTSSSPIDRVLRGPMNVRRARAVLKRHRPRRTIVFSSLDTAFEVSIASGAQVVLGWNVLLNIPQRRWARELGIPFWHPHSWRNPVYEELDRLASRTVVSGILAHSHFQERLYLALGIPQDRIRVVPHCLDLGAVDRAAAGGPDGRGGDQRVVVFAGNLEPWKGIVELVEACRRASTQVAITLRFVGRGSLEAYVQGLVEQPPGRDLRVEHTPWIPRTALLQMVRNCDLCVLPTYVELFGMVALEAMALGVPVLATRFGGTAELIRDGVDGRLVDPHDIPQFAASLAELLQDADLRSRMGESARSRVAAEYDVGVVAPRFLRAMEELS